MTMNIQTKEHLVYFMQCGMINLSKYDLKFMQNLHHWVTTKKPITTNQVALFEKLVGKYKRQLNKHNYSLELCNNLPWQSTIIPSDPNFTDAFISIEGMFLVFRSPFNKGFLKEFRNSGTHDFMWDRDKKEYVGKFGTQQLKLLLNTAVKYFPIVNLCEKTNRLVQTLNQYEGAQYWRPTLVKKNGRMFVAACNDMIYSLLKDVDIGDNDETFIRMSELGVNIDPELLTDPKTKFLGEFMTEVDINQINELVDWLKAYGCDCLVYHRYGTSINGSFMRRLEKEGFDIHKIGYNFESKEEKFADCKRAVYIEFMSTKGITFSVFHDKITKYVSIKNSNPIEIK